MAGKTLSLYYFLARRVALGLATFFQTEPDIVWFFHEEGVSLIDPGMYWRDVDGVDGCSNTTWALVDSNRSMNSPASVLCRRNAPFFIVEAASPRKGRWDWTKDRGYSMVMFYTKVFSLQEMLQGMYIYIRPFQCVPYIHLKQT